MRMESSSRQSSEFRPCARASMAIDACAQAINVAALVAHFIEIFPGVFVLGGVYLQ
jgi:hypothetical protein